MIMIVKGNLLNATEEIIAHQVNCQGVMGAGLALQIRNQFPSSYGAYKSVCNMKKPSELLGKIMMVGIEDKIICHMFAQLRYGRDKQHTDYNALRDCLASLNKHASAEKKSVALPYGIGCGLAGGDWNVVYQIIKSEMMDCNVAIYKL